VSAVAHLQTKLIYDHCRPIERPSLSPLQVDQQCVWKRAVEALPGARMVFPKISGRGIVQDNVADCSLVAALIVGAEHHAKFGSKVPLSRLLAAS
jgi:hypothetical protein